MHVCRHSFGEHVGGVISRFDFSHRELAVLYEVLCVTNDLFVDVFGSIGLNEINI